MILGVIAGFILFIVLGIIFFPPNIPTKTSETETESTEKTPTTVETDTPPEGEVADLDTDITIVETDEGEIPNDYGIDSSSPYRSYISFEPSETLIESINPSSYSLLTETISDYFSFAYPQYSSAEINNLESPFNLTIKGPEPLEERKFSIDISTNQIKISTLSGQVLLAFQPILSLTEESEELENFEEFDSLFEDNFNYEEGDFPI